MYCRMNIFCRILYYHVIVRVECTQAWQPVEWKTPQSPGYCKLFAAMHEGNWGV